MMESGLTSLLNDNNDDTAFQHHGQQHPTEEVRLLFLPCSVKHKVSIFFHLSGARLRGQLSEHGHPDFPLPGHVFQLFWEDPEVFPGQPSDIFTPACPGSSSRSLVSKRAPRHPAEENHFSRLYPGSHSFGHDPKFMTKGEGRYILTGKSRASPFGSALFSPDRQIHRLHYCGHCTDLSRSIVPSLVNKTPRYLNSST